MRKDKIRFHVPLKAAIWHARNHPAFREMLEEGRRKRAVIRLKEQIEAIGYPAQSLPTGHSILETYSEAERRRFIARISLH